ncbi:hypothetical protein JDV09_10835 [Mycobacterium sp. Y57]|uniref:hypothetical protein n=1 Tax=Mycolicibacterium xanthum TaxID=2796469 RepID=UPI001C84B85F|nr:hypothetical protein [Mycolicibacterium xanthum]MBX7432594.1 hypothetical protein [Mycolicibacterium xanthum]
MASIAGNPTGRWTLSGLLRRLQWSPRTAVRADIGAADRAVAAVAAEPRRRHRHYPPQRDRVFEHAAMAREMYRL